MVQEFQGAVEAAIERIAASGQVLDVNEDAGRIVGGMRSIADHSYDEVALALIKAASRRQVAMTFHNQEA